MSVDPSKEPAADDPGSQSPGYGAALLEVARPLGTPTGYGRRPGPSPPPRPGHTVPSPAVAVRPTPLPKRPKGRVLVSTLLICLCGGGLIAFWNALFRCEAYGSITGRIIDVSSPWHGVLQSLHVREGQAVRQGQLLATVRSHDLELQLARVGDEIQIAQATLDSQIAELRLKAPSCETTRPGKLGPLTMTCGASCFRRLRNSTS